MEQERMIETKSVDHIEVYRAVGSISGVAPLVGYFASFDDVLMIPDTVVAEWRRKNRGPWQLQPLEVTGFQVLKSGALSEHKRAELSPPPDHPMVAKWVRRNRPDVTYLDVE